MARTLSARYYKDGSEILVSRGKNKNPRRLTPRECARLMGFPDTFKIPVSDTQAYKLFSQAAVVPMITFTAKMMSTFLRNEGKVESTEVVLNPFRIEQKMISNRWTKDQLKVVFNLYCQLPFGKMHKGNPTIIKIAKLIGRTPDAVAMKLTNFASLDPAITSTGRTGLKNRSAADREIWEEFHADWERLALESQLILDSLAMTDAPELTTQSEAMAMPRDYFGETKNVATEARVKQAFFRKTVVTNFEGRCCITGLAEQRLLVASHIKPWANDPNNRLNPHNGLCLSALHDRAFDRGLLTVLPDLTVRVSSALSQQVKNEFCNRALLAFDGLKISTPKKFAPALEFLDYHAQHVFLA